MPKWDDLDMMQWRGEDTWMRHTLRDFARYYQIRMTTFLSDDMFVGTPPNVIQQVHMLNLPGPPTILAPVFGHPQPVFPPTGVRVVPNMNMFFFQRLRRVAERVAPTWYDGTVQESRRRTRFLRLADLYVQRHLDWIWEADFNRRRNRQIPQIFETR